MLEKYLENNVDATEMEKSRLMMFRKTENLFFLVFLKSPILKNDCRTIKTWSFSAPFKALLSF
jgi:hypothetical protein